MNVSFIARFGRANRLVIAVALGVCLSGSGTAAHGGPEAARPEGVLVLTSNRDGDRDVYAIAARGGRLDALTRNYDSDVVRSLGRTVAREWRGSVYALRPGGWLRLGGGGLEGVFAGGRLVVIEQPDALIFVTPGGRNRRRVPMLGPPAIAPDGRHVAFDQFGGKKPGIVVVDVATGNVRRIANGEDSYSSWSPDGRRLLVRNRPENGAHTTFVASVTSTRRFALPNCSDSKWSPGGRWLACLAGELERPTLTVLDAVTGARWTTAPGSYVGGLTWSRRTPKLAYVVDRDPEPNEVVVVDPRRRSERVVAHQSGVLDIRWAPDSRRVAYLAETSWDDESTRVLAVATADGSIGRTLVTGRNVELVAWYPDSRRVLYTNTGKIGVVGWDGRVRGTSPIAIARPRWVRWSPRGNAIAFSAGYSGASVYMLSGDGTSVRRLTHKGEDQVVAWLPSRSMRVHRAAAPIPPGERVRARTLETRGPVVDISADRDRVAALIAPSDFDCRHPIVWRPGGAVDYIGTPAPCDEEDRTEPLWIELRGGLVSWVTYTCGNECEGTWQQAAAVSTDVVIGAGYIGSLEPPRTQMQTVDGITVSVGGGALRLRSAEGRERVITATGARIFDAELEDAGLFYAYNVARGDFRGRIVFVPFGELLG